MRDFEVTGMTCGHCVRAVTEAVQQVDPAATVRIDLEASRAHIDSTAPADRLSSAIEAAGYTVRAAPP